MATSSSPRTRLVRRVSSGEGAAPLVLSDAAVSTSTAASTSAFAFLPSPPATVATPTPRTKRLVKHFSSASSVDSISSFDASTASDAQLPTPPSTSSASPRVGASTVARESPVDSLALACARFSSTSSTAFSAAIASTNVSPAPPRTPSNNSFLAAAAIASAMPASPRRPAATPPSAAAAANAPLPVQQVTLPPPVQAPRSTSPFSPPAVTLAMLQAASPAATVPPAASILVAAGSYSPSASASRASPNARAWTSATPSLAPAPAPAHRAPHLNARAHTLPVIPPFAGKSTRTATASAPVHTLVPFAVAAARVSDAASRFANSAPAKLGTGLSAPSARLQIDALRHSLRTASSSTHPSTSSSSVSSGTSSRSSFASQPTSHSASPSSSTAFGRRAAAQCDSDASSHASLPTAPIGNEVNDIGNLISAQDGADLHLSIEPLPPLRVPERVDEALLFAASSAPDLMALLWTPVQCTPEQDAHDCAQSASSSTAGVSMRRARSTSALPARSYCDDDDSNYNDMGNATPIEACNVHGTSDASLALTRAYFSVAARTDDAVRADDSDGDGSPTTSPRAHQHTSSSGGAMGGSPTLRKTPSYTRLATAGALPGAVPAPSLVSSLSLSSTTSPSSSSSIPTSLASSPPSPFIPHAPPPRHVTTLKPIAPSPSPPQTDVSAAASATIIHALSSSETCAPLAAVSSPTSVATPAMRASMSPQLNLQTDCGMDAVAQGEIDREIVAQARSLIADSRRRRAGGQH